MRYTFDSGVRAPLRVPAHRCRSDNAFPHAAEAAVDAIAQRAGGISLMHNHSDYPSPILQFEQY